MQDSSVKRSRIVRSLELKLVLSPRQKQIWVGKICMLISSLVMAHKNYPLVVNIVSVFIASNTI